MGNYAIRLTMCCLSTDIILAHGSEFDCYVVWSNVVCELLFFTSFRGTLNVCRFSKQRCVFACVAGVAQHGEQCGEAAHSASRKPADLALQGLSDLPDPDPIGERLRGRPRVPCQVVPARYVLECARCCYNTRLFLCVWPKWLFPSCSLQSYLLPSPFQRSTASCTAFPLTPVWTKRSERSRGSSWTSWLTTRGWEFPIICGSPRPPIVNTGSVEKSEEKCFAISVRSCICFFTCRM